MAIAPLMMMTSKTTTTSSCSAKTPTPHSIADIVPFTQHELSSPREPCSSFISSIEKNTKHHPHHPHRHHHHRYHQTKHHPHHRRLRHGRHRHHHHHHPPHSSEHQEESNRGPFTVIAGHDIPANVTGSPMETMPTLGRDLLSSRDGEDLTTMPKHHNIHVFCVDGRMETEDNTSLGRVVASLRSAKDRHEQNVELLEDGDNPGMFCARTIKPIRRGQPLLIWYGEGLAREMGVPVLTPSNIRGNQEYVCTQCHSVFAQPNVLKAHLILECSLAHFNHVTRQVPFHALLDNIRTCFTASSSSSSSSSRRSLLLSQSELSPNTASEAEATNHIAIDTSTGDNQQSTLLTGDSSSNAGTSLLSTRLPSSHIMQTTSESVGRGRRTTSHAQQSNQTKPNDLSPSLSTSSSSLDSSFLDENDDDDDDDEAIANNSSNSSKKSNNGIGGSFSGQRQHLRNQHEGVRRSAFHRPSRVTTAKRRLSPDVISQIPDSSTDQQRSALNLSVKNDDDPYCPSSILSSNSPACNRHSKNFLTQSIIPATDSGYPWVNPMGPTSHSQQHIGVFPIDTLQHPMCYPITANTTTTTNNNNNNSTVHLPSTSLAYFTYYNQFQFSRNFNDHNNINNIRTRESYQSAGLHAQNAESSPLSGQPASSPKRENHHQHHHQLQLQQNVVYPNHDSCPPMDHHMMSPINPYALSLPSDKEPLDLLPQTYFTNKSKRGHLCLYCGKLYSRKYGLKIHMRTHNGYKPLKCKICSRPFGDPSNLNKHVRLHAQGETPYRCDYCGKVLVRRRDLERHVRSRHPMGNVPVDTSSPLSSPISVEDSDMSPFQESVVSATL